jgi:hypothetical protein
VCGKHRITLGKVGDDCVCKNSNGYYSVKHQKKDYRVHRVIWELFFGEIPCKMYIDHIDGDINNNKISNLRLVDHAYNMRNRKKNKNSGKMQGVTRAKQRTRKDGSFSEVWLARWYELSDGDHRAKSKSFNIDVHGEDVAFALAVAYRNKMIEQLNFAGAGYTTRHGSDAA